MTRNEIIARIQKLQRLSTANGCTEAEATLAGEHVARLLSEHNIAMSEISLKADATGCLKDAYSEVNNRHGDWQFCMSAIAYAFSCKTWLSETHEDVFDLGFTTKCVQATYFGYPADVAGAIALTAICSVALATESEHYLAKHGGGKSAGTSFRRAMASCLSERIHALRVTPASTGRDLIVLKHQLVQQEFTKTGIKLRSVNSASEYRFNEHAAAHGRLAGDRTAIGQKAMGQTRALPR